MLSKEYTTLFNAITDAIEILKTAQQQAEEIFISKDSAPLTFKSGKKDLP